MKVNFSIPVELFDFRESSNSLYSYAKLKIFYIGETPDKRLFTKDFSDQLLESLPYVPVVGFYDEEGEDFVGHNPEIQNIYGLVPEDTVIEYVEEGGKNYAVCDVILYTGRKDRTGEIAQKIVGKSHSLELNPENTTYTVNRDAEGEFINIEFKTGTLLGLSILGDNEQPAFTGSEFFTEQSFQEEIFRNLREFISSRKTRGEEMNFDKFTSALEFIKKSYSEKINDLVDVLRKRIGDAFYVEQLFDNYVIVTYWDFDLERPAHKRFFFSSVDDKTVINKEEDVLKRFLTKEEVKNWEDYLGFKKNQLDVEEYEINSGEEIEDSVEDDAQEPADDSFIETEEVFEREEQEETEGTETNEGETGDDFEEETAESSEETEEGPDSETFSESERAELEALREEVYGYRREAKLTLLDSFEEDLSVDFLDILRSNLDNYDFESLEVELSKEFTRVSRERNSKKQPKFIPFSHNGKTNINTTNDKDENIKRLVETHK